MGYKETGRDKICLTQSARGSIAWWLVLVSVTLLVIGGNVGKLVHEAEAAGTVFEAGPLAQPKSLEQTGLPRDATRGAIPPDNPQTPEKIALGERLFFEPRLSADGTIACSCFHRW